MTIVIDGRKLAGIRETALKQAVSNLRAKGMVPRLVSLVMSGDEAGLGYLKLKAAAAVRIGVELEKVVVSDWQADEVMGLIRRFNQDDKVQGMMVQRPGVRWGEKQGMGRSEFEAWWSQVVAAIDAKKDVDGLTAKSRFLSATVKAVGMVLEQVGVAKGRMVVVGSQGLVGRRLVEYFSDKEFKVEGVDVDERELGRMTKKADVLVSATGKPGLIKAEMVKKGAVVIDVGWPKGDVKFGEVKEKASVITPVPGGIGPLTVVSLLENLVEAVYSA